MPSHKHIVGLPVILSDTGEMGTINLQLTPQAGMPKYRISVAGRPETPSQAEGDPSTRNDVDETLVLLGMTAAQKTTADSLMRGYIRTLSVSERSALKASKIVGRDNAGSTDHRVSEAVRYVEAIVTVEGE